MPQPSPMDRARLTRLVSSASLASFAVAVAFFFAIMLFGPSIGEPRVGHLGRIMYVGWGGGIALGALALVLWLTLPRGQKAGATIAFAPLVVFALLLLGFALLVYLIFSGLGNV